MADPTEVVDLEVANGVIDCCPGASTCPACSAAAAPLARAVIALDEEVRKLRAGLFETVDRLGGDTYAGAGWTGAQLVDAARSIVDLTIEREVADGKRHRAEVDTLRSERDEARRDLTAAEALLVVATGTLCRCGKTWCIQSCTAERLVTYLATKERD